MSEWTPPASDPGGYFAGWPTPAGPATPPAATVNQFGTPIVTAPPAAPVSSGYMSPPPAPSSANRTRNIVAAVVAVVIVAAGVVWLLRPSHHSLSAPPTAAGYQLLSGTEFSQVRDSTNLQLSDVALKDTVVGVYGSGTTPFAEVFAARPAKHADAVYQGLLESFGTDATTPLSSVDPGHLGGQMMCGTVPVHGALAPTCAWGDRDTFGVIFLVGGSSATAATQAVEFRDAIEH